MGRESWRPLTLHRRGWAPVPPAQAPLLWWGHPRALEREGCLGKHNRSPVGRATPRTPHAPRCLSWFPRGSVMPIRRPHPAPQGRHMADAHPGLTGSCLRAAGGFTPLITDVSGDPAVKQRGRCGFTHMSTRARVSPLITAPRATARPALLVDSDPWRLRLGRPPGLVPQPPPRTVLGPCLPYSTPPGGT